MIKTDGNMLIREALFCGEIFALFLHYSETKPQSDKNPLLLRISQSLIKSSFVPALQLQRSTIKEYAVVTFVLAISEEIASA